MNEIKKTLINRAKMQFKLIFPCSPKKSLRECFTIEENLMIFWFNTEDDTTHILTQNLW
jgi:hypothetical protein